MASRAYTGQERATALLGLLHPLPVMLTVALALTIGFLAAPDGPTPPLLWLGTSVLLTQCAISVHNDYCDRRLDAIAKPRRAIPSGAISAQSAGAVATVLLIAGIAASVPLGTAALLLGVLGTGAGLAYSARLKRTALSWLPFWIGFPTLALWALAAVDRLESRAVAVYIVGLPIVLAVHLADTLPDLGDDAAHGVRGLAHRLGFARARATCWAALALALAAGALVRPEPGHIGAPFVVAAGLLVCAIVVRDATRRAHWLAVVGAAIALTLDWLPALVLPR